MANLILNLVGDVCLTNISDETYAFSESVNRVLKAGDINVANLECAITRRTKILPYQPIHLKVSPIETSVFHAFDVFSLANNHVLDYCQEGLFDTIAFLKQYNKKYFGAGRNKTEACEPTITQCRGIKVAFVGFTRFNNATSFRPGTAPDNIRAICRTIRSLKDAGCFVIVCPHWNYQWIDYPAPDEIAKGHLMVDAGADLVVGAHPHVIQGAEFYKGKYVWHSLGNFVFRNTKYTKAIPQFGKTAILQVSIRDDLSYETTAIPAFSDNNGVYVVEDPEELARTDQHMKHMTNILKNRKDASRAFYDASLFIEHHNKVIFGELSKEGGIAAILHAYMDANLQDVKRKLYAICFKTFGVKIF